MPVTNNEGKFTCPNNRLRTTGLFVDCLPRGGVETALYRLYPPSKSVLLTNTDVNYMGTNLNDLPILKDLYLEMEDITEYQFANKYFESWEHWQRILDVKQLYEYVLGCREELELKLRAEALIRITTVSRRGGKNGYEADKYLVNHGWDASRSGVNKTKKGRPSKEDLNNEVRRRVDLDNRIEIDFKKLQRELQ